MNTDVLLEVLRTNVADVKETILAQENSRDALIIAKSYLSPQSYGALLETWIKKRMDLGDKLDNLSGDASHNIKTFEIKVSIEDKIGKFNYVQLRPSHSVDAYIILNYSITLDEVLWLYIPHNEMITMINESGGYAHGTLAVQGAITLQSIQSNSYEYCIRPNMHKPNTQAGKTWQALTKYRVSEDELRQILHKT
jgi:hypothetical protein|tara:strand:- start:206 stop:790 length:585 start_codon:yes stop_codon:yes gene_type:complete